MADKKNHDRHDQQTAEDVTLPADDDPTKDNVVEYFGADGEEEGQKLMENPDGSWGGPGAVG